MIVNNCVSNDIIDTQDILQCTLNHPENKHLHQRKKEKENFLFLALELYVNTQVNKTKNSRL